MKILIPLYPRFTALDVVGPYDMLGRIPGCTVELVAASSGPVENDLGSLELLATGAFTDHRSADVVVVPGGPGTAEALSSGLPEWLWSMRPNTHWMASVCSGSLLLGAAGLLEGLPATSHYRVRDMLRNFGAEPCSDRVVIDDRNGTATAAGVSAGIDLGISLAALLSDPTTAQAIQLWTEYDPQPPFGAGSPERASREVQELAAFFERQARG